MTQTENRRPVSTARSNKTASGPVRRMKKGLSESTIADEHVLSSTARIQSVIDASLGTELEERHFSVLECGSIRSYLCFDDSCTLSAPDAVEAFLRFYDYRGELFQQARIQCPLHSEFDLNPFISACRLQHGLRHCHLEVVHSIGARARCILRSDRGLVMQTGEHLCDEKSMRCLPVYFNEGREQYLFVSSLSDTTVRMKVKMLAEKRSLESITLVRSHASSMIRLKSLFPASTPLIGKAGGDQGVPSILGGSNQPQYLRVSMRGAGKVALMLLESKRSQVGTEFVSGIA